MRVSGAIRKIPAEYDRALRDHEDALLADAAAPALTKLLCAAMVAGITACTPLLVEYRRRARECGASAQMLTDLWNNAQSGCYDEAQRAALAAAVALTREPRALPPAVRSALETHFSPAAQYEIIAAIGAANYRCRVVNALGG